MKKKTINTLLILAMAVACAIIMGTVAFANTENEPLCFTAVSSDSTVKLVKGGVEAPDVSLQYKVNNDSWGDYTIGNPITLSNVGDKVYFRATSENSAMAVYSLPDVENSNIFEMSGKIAASGNVMSLLSSSCTSLSGRASCFAYLFYNCTSLTQAPELPAEALEDFCYSNMFDGCTGLIVAPKLPATELQTECYSSMFSSCTSLTQAPELLAEELGTQCYCSMFSGCTSLMQAPELPATELKIGCYQSMFSGCTSLTKFPELPAEAEALIYDCYYKMFQGCSGIEIITSADCAKNKCYRKAFTVVGSTSYYYSIMLPDGTDPSFGETYYYVTNHHELVYTSDDAAITEHYGHCTKCTYVDSGEPHSYGIPFNKDGIPTIKCEVCGYEHGHNKCLIGGKEATCMEDGWRDYYECTGNSSCGKYFSDSDCINEIDNPVAWKAEGGKINKRHKGARIPQQDATATTDGVKAYCYCRFCDKYYQDNNNPDNPFGTEIGNESALELWKAGDGKIPKTGTEPIPTPGESTHIHTFSNIWNKSDNYHWHAATCEHIGFTSDFGEHNYTVVAYKKGIKTSICATCGYEKKEKMTLAVPKTTLKVAAGKKYVTAKWTKKSVTGYQLQYGLKSNFKGAKTLTLKSATKVSQKIMKLKSKKKYYVRIRCYTNAYDTTYHSGWVAKKVVIK